MIGRPKILETSTECPDCHGRKYRYAQYCKSCASKGERNSRWGAILTPETRALISASRPARMPERTGELHPMWKGDGVSRQGGRGRAMTLYPLAPCAVCSSQKSERHHVDGNTRNNEVDNVLCLCRPHHRQIHPGHGRVPLRSPTTLGLVLMDGKWTRAG